MQYGAWGGLQIKEGLGSNATRNWLQIKEGLGSGHVPDLFETHSYLNKADALVQELAVFSFTSKQESLSCAVTGS